MTEERRLRAHTIRGTFGSREVFGAISRHPIASIQFLRGEKHPLRSLLAWEVACRALGLTSRYPEPSSHIESLADLQSQITGRQRDWPDWDSSQMSTIKGPLLYHLVRLSRPDAIVETGVASGVSSCFILQALKDNRSGTLASIDLPNMDPGALTPPWGGSGWMVPEPLRARWTLELGDSRALLPTVLSRLGSVGLFFHDSLHTYDHMLWEYETAWPYLKPAGLLVSDDISRNDAFSEFCRSRRMTYRVVGGFGIARRS